MRIDIPFFLRDFADLVADLVSDQPLSLFEGMYRGPLPQWIESSRPSLRSYEAELVVAGHADPSGDAEYAKLSFGDLWKAEFWCRGDGVEVRIVDMRADKTYAFDAESWAWAHVVDLEDKDAEEAFIVAFGLLLVRAEIWNWNTFALRNEE